MGLGSNAVWTGTVTNPGNVGWTTDYAADVKLDTESTQPVAFQVEVGQSPSTVAANLAAAFNAANSGTGHTATPDGGKTEFPGNVTTMTVNNVAVSTRGSGTAVGNTGLRVRRVNTV
ncbi:MAG: hypothetical protein PVI86_10060 [Phycisphaerae bacterium]|jgi:hypothetical protein